MAYTFEELLQLAEREAGGADVPTRATIVKELLHYDILLALSRSEMSQRLVFQGGTALRLCYGGQRYSEDLDFVCGHDASEPFVLDEVMVLLREHVSERYGLDLEVKSPGPDRVFDGEDVVVKRWSVNIHVPGFAAKQKIHFEICNVPAYQAEPTLLQPRYDFLSDVYSDIALQVESQVEIYADKIVALIGRSHVKARDLWDLRWLEQRGATPDYDLVQRKVDDYGLEDVPDRIDRALAALRAPGAAKKFEEEMVRFVTPSIAKQMLSKSSSSNPWLDNAQRLLGEAQSSFLDRPSPR
ncbi:putative nucleotidyltransferase component of viral defense system [Xanthomonas sacchari]|uniref:nucleotidyl transferase AbiEii/AbiGii toxin family protein n=1 Tax=Xanthomonas sacchari TaxID=56458 RepID=UPI002787B9E7|nr:nucleotidyl transferase AbiEii/AbiGii toxin family protein [Xanthomonas sacchari]MDQ1090678.1 putative nucleotidyltransferase component of viral defense system [Xanthomonas sacchari]